MAGRKAKDGKGDYRTVGINVSVHLEDMPRDLASARHEAILASQRGGRAVVEVYSTGKVFETYENGKKVRR
jgi:hypothetical protein